MLVAILGPDGSGKTTISLEIESALKNNVDLNTCLYAQRFGIFPTLSDLMKLDFSKSIKTDDLDFHQDESIVNSPLKSLIHLVYYGLEYILGGFLFKASIRSNKVVLLFGRYYYDFYFQRNHSRLSPFLISLIEKVIPKPDLVLILDRNADDIFRSKPELPTKEIKRQQIIISRLEFNNAVTHRIDCNCSVQESVEKCLELITDRLAAIS
jgi:thymidylate kinase